MLIDGLYQVDVLSLSNEKTSLGLVHLKEGVISGSDAAYNWSGNYKIEDAKISADFTAAPQRDVLNIFGEIAPINLELSGDCTDADNIELIGVRKENPEHKLAVSLVRVPV